MDTVILEVTDAAASRQRFIRACETGVAAKAARISFDSVELLWQVLNANRWGLLKAMTGAGEIGLRELSRRVGRDVKAVHTDTRVLLNAGVIDRAENGKLLFPYRHVKLRFDFDAAQEAAA